MAEPITLRVDGRIYEGWQKVRITRSLRDIAGDFELSLTARDKRQRDGHQTAQRLHRAYRQ